MTATGGGLGISISAHGRFVSRTRELLDITRRADGLGFDQVTIGEHVLLSREVAQRDRILARPPGDAGGGRRRD